LEYIARSRSVKTFARYRGFNFGMTLCGTVGLIRATGLKVLGTFTDFGVCRRFRWASVVGSGFSRVIPVSNGRVAVSTPSRMAKYVAVRFLEQLDLLGPDQGLLDGVGELPVAGVVGRGQAGGAAAGCGARPARACGAAPGTSAPSGSRPSSPSRRWPGL